jgi:nitrite reductase (cytochrome c-552)
MSQPIADVNAKIEEPISCYNCHENNPESNAVTQAFFLKSLGNDVNAVPIESQVCGQCHNEYYFNPTDSSVVNSYTSLEEMDPFKMYDYYKSAGAGGAMFTDYTNPNTGVKQLKAQHPEFEWVYGGVGNSMITRVEAATGKNYTCASCHMGPSEGEKADDGTMYTNHTLTSPLKNAELMKTCNVAGCHTNLVADGVKYPDLSAFVTAIQEEYMDRCNSTGDKLKDLNLKLTDAAAKNTLSADKLVEIQELNREAQWYWDFAMVENSDGAHNPELFRKCFDASEKLTDQALTMFN